MDTLQNKRKDEGQTVRVFHKKKKGKRTSAGTGYTSKIIRTGFGFQDIRVDFSLFVVKK